MSARPLIGQTVVTDPDTGRSGGYVLVAASPDVQPADAQHLSAAPQVTDYLHLESSPRPCFSFYPLPSGRWALAKRFVRGTRRGAFNRVVAHSMLVPTEVLRAVAEEPWLLLTRCRFRPRQGGRELTPAELGESAAAAGSGSENVEELPDLECLAPPDPFEEALALLRRRREVLRKRWDDAAITRRLETIFATLAGAGNVLLPQDAESEQLLAFGWSALPAGDRLEVPWTTHLAPSAAAIFRCANTPDPEAVRRDQPAPERWLIPGRHPPPADPGGGAAALARFLMEDGRLDAGGAFGELSRGLRRRRARLAGESAEIRRGIVWLERGGAALGAGFDDPARLQELLEELRSPARGDGEKRPLEPWIGRPQLLSCAAGSVLAMHGAGHDLHSAFAAVSRILKKTRWQPRLLALPVLTELVQVASTGSRSAGMEVVPVAIRLAALTLPEPPAGLEQREEILELLLESERSAGSGRRRSVAGEVALETLSELAIDLGRSASATVGAAIDALARDPRGLERVLAKVAPDGRNAPGPRGAGPRVAGPRVAGPRMAGPRDLPWLLAALRAAGGASPLGRRIAAGWLTPLLLREPEILEARSDADFLAWSRTLHEITAAGDGDDRPAASKLRAAWWLELARRPPREVPREALEMLGGLGGDDRKIVAGVWSRRIWDHQPRRDGASRPGASPGARALLPHLARLADGDPELAFTYALEGLAAALHGGEIDLERALGRAARLARQSPSGARGGLARAVQKLLPEDPETRARTVVRLLLSPSLPPSSKRVLDTAFRDRALRAAGDALPGILPRVRDLAGRGALLLRAADLLGSRWSRHPEGATRFVYEAVELRRFDAVATFLERSEKRSDRRRRGFLEHLGREGDSHLLRRLAAATRGSGSPRCELRAFAPAIDRLQAANSGRRH